MSNSELKEGITLSEVAKAHVKTYLAENPESLGLRISIKKTGCSGYAYAVDLAKEIKDSDHVFEFRDFFLYIDDKSYPFVKGMQVDYVKDGFNKKFMFLNPNESGSCGCGESFTI